MKVIGITGGVGSGKSAVLDAVKAAYKAEILKADELAQQLKLPGGICYEPLLQLLGEEILEEKAQPGEKPGIDNRKMAALIFADKALLEKVNAIMHPRVREEIVRRIESCRRQGEKDYFFLEAALLLEEGYDRVVDEMWYIYADEASRISRLRQSRGYTEAASRAIMEKQLGEEEFRQRCDVIIDNSGTLEDAMRQVEKHLTGSIRK